MGMLTASGMRQRYLLGRYNREKYINKYNLLDENYVESQVYIETSDVYRTLQSTYSEMTGMFPPKSLKRELSKK